MLVSICSGPDKIDSLNSRTIRSLWLLAIWDVYGQGKGQVAAAQAQQYFQKERL
jgi:hypothetical protein